jgi:hypothetical protein
MEYHETIVHFEDCCNKKNLGYIILKPEYINLCFIITKLYRFFLETYELSQIK